MLSASTNEQAHTAASRNLSLEAFVNGRSSERIVSFEQQADGRFLCKRSDLNEIGIFANDGDPNELIYLDSILDLSFTYNEPAQTMNFTAGASARAAKVFDQAITPETAPLTRGTGALVNYNIFSSAVRPITSGYATTTTPAQINNVINWSPQTTHLRYQGANATLDSRIFSQFGTVTQSAIVGESVNVGTTQRSIVRLDSRWTYSDQDTMVTYKGGDVVTSGLAWSRPVRIGGGQIERNFAVRPDLVTLPMPSISGSAAVPSTVDVYVNNVKSFSSNVDEGPYRIQNLPLIGAGTAKVMVQDASGRQVEQTVPFYTSQLLLRPGYSDYSVEMGLPRNFYGAASDHYAKHPIVSGSYRRGLTEWLTVEAHGEGARNLVNAGGGVSVALGGYGVLNAAGAGSWYHGYSGALLYAAIETRLWDILISASGQRTFGRYEDAASVTLSNSNIGHLALTAANNGYLDPTYMLGAGSPPREIERLTANIPLYFDKSNIGVSLMRIQYNENNKTNIANINWSRNLPFDATFFLSGYRAIFDHRNYGLFAGLSLPLGAKTHVSLGVTKTHDHVGAAVDAVQSVDHEPGSWGWRVRDVETHNKDAQRMAEGTYRSQYGQVQGAIWQDGPNARGTVAVDGSIATMGGGVFMGNRIDDAFAVVDAGAPDVDVYQDNHRIARTNGSGQALVPDLRSFQRNKITIDSGNLPVNAQAGATERIVAPADRGGVLVDFNVRTNMHSAIVILTRADGKPVPPGSHATLAGAAQQLTVGYDGRLFIPEAASSNEVHVKIGLSECVATFNYAGGQGVQTTIGPVVCQ